MALYVYDLLIGHSDARAGSMRTLSVAFGSDGHAPLTPTVTLG